MNLIDGIKHKGRPYEIPDCSRNDLPQFFVDMGFKCGVEIGVDDGEFSELFCKVGLEHYSIDPWVSYRDYPIRGGQRKMDSKYEETKVLLSKYPNSIIIRKTSMEALSDFKDNSIDYVYLDGNHLLKYVTEDLCGWTCKVKSGGIVAGHDYALTAGTNVTNSCHVVHALNAYINAYHIKQWYVLGLKCPPEGGYRDRWRSWMFIKE